MKTGLLKVIAGLVLSIMTTGCADDLSFSDSSPAAKSDDQGVGFYNQPPVAVAHKNKCTFHFTGLKGARWISERYIRSEEDCSSIQPLVQANNPNADIYKIETNYVHDPLRTVDKNKCTFRFRGQNGALWLTERYISWGLNCNGELPVVRANNPLAQILSVSSNYVHMGTQDISKVKCTFRLRGAGSAEWISERYIAANLSCESEMQTVGLNNPNAAILEVTSNFVHDPF